MTAGPDRTRWRLTAVIAQALLLASAVGHADPKAAVETFKKGRELFKAGKFAAACEQFEQSQQLDPAMGTLFNIAQCDEKIGKLASAIAAYREIVASDTNDKRKATAAEYAVKLELRVPKIVIGTTAIAVKVRVTLDGKPVEPNQPIEVDFGTYTIIGHADGYRDASKRVTIGEESRTTSVPLTLEPDHSTPTPVPGPVDPTPPKDPTQPVDEPAVAPAARSSRKTIGVVTLGVGGAALATGVVFAILTHGKWSDAQAVCGGTVCPTQPQVDQANALADQAHSDGNLATVFAIGGAVAAAVGVALIVTAPSAEHAVRVTATVDRSAGGFAIAGRF
jgi:hypothetical protein